MSIIEINSVTKEYRLGQMTNLKESALNFFNRMRGKAFFNVQKFKALDDITFKVESGEVVGIIGTNGAGKSTMLKILARVITPTKGKARVNGSVAPLIEVGAGLHPELTGRENIYLNGSILGISRQIIRKKFDEIVEFAELEEFINTPVKRYSSGMTIRLGFSIATAVDSDILIVDEVLAVGDLAFQRKCFDRMEELIKKRGKTVLIVSHNIRQIERICSRVILLDRGSILMNGDPGSVCNMFYVRSNSKVLEYAVNSQKHRMPIESSGEVEVKDITLFNGNKNIPVNSFKMYEPMRIGIHFYANVDVPSAEIIIGFHTTDFVYIASASSSILSGPKDIKKGENYIEFALDSIPLNPGVYCIRLGINDEYSRRIWYGENMTTFKVDASDINKTKHSTLGLVELPFKITKYSCGN